MLKSLDKSIKISKEKIPVFKPYIQSSEINAASISLKDGWLGMGRSVKEFEGLIEKQCEIYSSKKAVTAVSTGHAALHLSLMIMQIKPGDEVITPSFNNTADFQAIRACGANPVFVDIDEKNLCIDPNKIEEMINNKTKCIIAMDYGSWICDHDRIRSIGLKHNIPIIHDASHSFGSKYNGVPIGNQHEFTTFSFDPVKSITSIDGGAIVLDKKKHLKKAQAMRLIGMTQSAEQMYKNSRAWTYDVENLGYRYHLSNLHAAIGVEQIKKIDKIIKTRTTSCKRYDRGLKDLPWMDVPDLTYKDICPFLYTIRVKGGKRDRLREYLKNLNVDTGLHWQPGHKFKFFNKSRRGNLKVTEKISDQIVSLPLHTSMNKKDLDYVISAIRGFR